VTAVNKETIITGLDIGSSKVSAVMAEIDRGGAFRVLSHVTMPSKGMVKGAFLDLSESVDVVSKVLAAIRSKTLKRPSNIYVNITGLSVKGSRSRGMVPLALRGREVTKRDIDRCIDVASTVHLPFDREIIHKVVQNFSVDDQPWINCPLGLYASRLSSEVYIITASVNHIQNLYKCVNNTGYDVKV
jgi:cell division protein FtsA